MANRSVLVCHLLALLQCHFMSPQSECSRRGRRPQGGAPSLDKTTKSPAGHVDGGRVRVTVYPNAGEVVLSPLDGRREVNRKRKPDGPKNAEACKIAAVSRAKRELRRFCKEFRLCFMWTLTFDGGQCDVDQLRRQVERFIAKVVEDRGGQRFPYAYVVEPHADGERLHVHMAVGFFFPHKRLGVLWGKGFVWCTDKRKRGECAHVGANRAAGYLAKYVGKTFEHSEFGRHRYERARGFDVSSYQLRRKNFDDGQRYAEALFLAAPEYVWNSEQCAEWRGPRVRVLFFKSRPRDG